MGKLLISELAKASNFISDTRAPNSTWIDAGIARRSQPA